MELATLPKQAHLHTVLVQATKLFLDGQKLDMTMLAKQLGIGRATLYRWIGDRNQLLIELLWSMHQAMYHSVKQTAPKSGEARLNHLISGIIDAVVDSAAYRAFLHHEGMSGLKLITSSQGLHGRIVEQVKELIAQESEAGRYRPPSDVDTLAESAVALSEYFLYAQFVVKGFVPQADQAKRAVALLLRENQHCKA